MEPTPTGNGRNGTVGGLAAPPAPSLFLVDDGHLGKRYGMKSCVHPPPLAPHNHQSRLPHRPQHPCPLETTRTELFLVGFIHQSMTNGVLEGMPGSS